MKQQNAIAENLDSLRSILGEIQSVVVAFSGGADSALLAWVANEQLGDNAKAVTAVSASLPAQELQHCRQLATQWGLRWSEVKTHEQADANYRANDTNRCAYCRESLMDALVPLAEREDSVIALGVTLDDLDDHRPGIAVSKERGARFPLVEAEVTKQQVRDISRSLGLTTWDKPSSPCLASRIPYGTPVSVELLGRVEQAEAELGRLGFAELRVRHYGDTARIEVTECQIQKLLSMRQQVVEAVKSAGYRYVTVDLEGLRPGNLNDAI